MNNISYINQKEIDMQNNQQDKETIRKIMEIYRPSQVEEIQKWIDNWVIEWDFMTLCDVRRKVEFIIWIAVANLDIVNAIAKTGWVISDRPESRTPDYCFVDMDYLIKIIQK